MNTIVKHKSLTASYIVFTVLWLLITVGVPLYMIAVGCNPVILIYSAVLQIFKTSPERWSRLWVEWEEEDLYERQEEKPEEVK